MAATAFLFTGYYLLDLMDGKQARKTGNSTPLGMLVDHGVDAMVTVLISMSLGSVLKFQGAFMYFLIWSMMTVTFFFATLEEYYTGVLELPWFNGVSEGNAIAFGVIMFTIYKGQSFWLNTTELFGYLLHYNQILIIGLCLFSLFFTIIR